MKNVKRWAAFLLALCMIASLLCGCDDRSEDQEKVTVRAAATGVPATLDPALVTKRSEQMAVACLFENLMKTTADGIANGQAKSYEIINNDDGSQTYYFTLRSDIKWSDGKAVTAEDFAFAWQRLVDPATASPHADILESVAGYEDAAAGVDNALQVWADEQGRLVVVLSEADPYFLSAVCTSIYTMPVRSDAVELASWSMQKSTLKTNGAYGLRQWVDNTMILVELEEYYDAMHVGPDQLEITFSATEQESMSLFEQKDMDLCFGAEFSEESTVLTLPKVCMVVVNQMSSTLGKEAVRQAMSKVIDRNAISSAIGDNYVAASGIIPEGIRTLAGSSFRQANGDVLDILPEDYQANVATAQEMMQRAGYSGSNVTGSATLGTITLLYETNSTSIRIASMLQSMWKDKLNVDVTCVPVASSEMEVALAEGEFTMAILSMEAGRNDALDMLSAWRSTDERNAGQYYSSAYEMLMNVAEKTDKVEAHDAYLEDAERLLVESGYVMPICFASTSYIIKSDLSGFYTNGLGVPYLMGVHRVVTMS